MATPKTLLWTSLKLGCDTSGTLNERPSSPPVSEDSWEASTLKA